MKNKLESKIEHALVSKFPGLKCSFVIHDDGSWDFNMLPGSKERFDEQYPGMNREQADARIVEDMKSIISKFMPDTEFVGYRRYGTYTTFGHELKSQKAT